MRKVLLISFLLLFVQGLLQAQALKMQVLSETTKSPVPLVSVVLLPKNESTIADMEGRFSLMYSNPDDTLMIMSIGYKVYKEKISNLIGKPTLFLEDENVVLDDVKIVVKKKKRRNRKTDPAYLLHKAIIEHSEANDFRGNEAYSCNIYNRVEVDVNNVTDNTRELLLFKPIAFLFDDIDSTSLPKKFVPVLFSEVVTDYYHGADGGKKEIVKGSKVSGVEIQSLAQFTGNMYMGYNIYDDYLNLFQKSFVSPLADKGWLTYNFYLTDSVKTGDTTRYKLEFIPRRKNELAFKGQLWTDDKTFAIHEIHLQILKTANVNYINQFEIDLNYTYRDSAWILEKEDILMDVYLTDNQYGFYVKKSSDFLNYKYPVTFEKDFFSAAKKAELWDSIADYGDQEIARLRPSDEGDSVGVKIYAKMDSVMNTPYIRFIKNLGMMYYSGFYPFKYFEVGPYYSIYSYNSIEGSRFRVGGATRTKLFPNTQLLGHLAYGNKDKKYKKQLRVTHFFNKKNWRYIRLNYFYDYSILSSSTNSFSSDNILASLSRRVSPRFTHVKKYSGEWFHSWFAGLENYLQASWEEYRPIGTLVYQKPDLTSLQLIRMNTVKIGGRIAIDEKFAYNGFRRFSFKTRKPIINYGFTQGIVIDGQGYEFSKLELEFIDKYFLGFMGYLKVVANAGKVWGKLPYPMLLNHTGNDSYYYDNKAFNLMNPFEFVSDEQVSLMLSHHFNGLIMNQVPLFKRLHWRSFVFGRAAMGRLSAEHEELVILPQGLSALKEPYVEAGVGMENVFKIIRVDFLWRLSNIGPDTPRFGINFAVQPRL